MWLSGLVLVINAAGVICLFLWGNIFFSSSAICAIVAGFSALQAVTAAIAFIAQCNVSWVVLVRGMRYTSVKTRNKKNLLMYPSHIFGT